MISIIKGLQARLLEMMSEFSSLLKHFQELNTQFEEKYNFKIKLATYIEEVYGKWTQYRQQIRGLERSKEQLRNTLDDKMQHLLQHTHTQRLLKRKIRRLEEMMRDFLTRSGRILEREVQLPEGEIAAESEHEEEEEGGSKIKMSEHRESSFSNAMLMSAIKLYNVVCGGLRSHWDFESHLEFLNSLQSQMQVEFSKDISEDKSSLQIEQRNILGLVQDYKRHQDDLAQAVSLLKPFEKEEQQQNEDKLWTEVSQHLASMEGLMSQRQRITLNYHKIIKNEKNLVEKCMKVADPSKELWELCDSMRPKLIPDKDHDKKYDQDYDKALSEYIKCFKDLMSTSDQQEQGSVHSLKMIILHETRLIAGLYSDISKISSGIFHKNKVIEEGLKRMMIEANDRDNLLKSVTEKLEEKHKSYLDIFPHEHDRRNQSNFNSSFLVEAGDQKPGESFVRKDTDLDKRKSKSRNRLLQKASLYSEFPREPESLEKLPGSPIKTGSFLMQLNKVPVKVEEKVETHPQERISVQSISPPEEKPPPSLKGLEESIRYLKSEGKDVQAEQQIQTYMLEAAKTVKQAKQIEKRLSSMLQFVKGQPPVPSNYLQVFEALGDVEKEGRLKFVFEKQPQPEEYKIKIHSEYESQMQSYIKEEPEPQESRLRQEDKLEVSIQTQEIPAPKLQSQTTPLDNSRKDTSTQTQVIQRLCKQIEIVIAGIQDDPVEVKDESEVREVGVKERRIGQQLERHVQTESIKDMDVSSSIIQEELALALNENIKLSTGLLEKNQQIHDLKRYRDKFNKEREENDALTKEIKGYEEEKTQRISREQEFIKQIVEGLAPTISEHINAQLRERICALMFKIISLTKEISDIREEFQLNTLKMNQECDNLKNLVCSKLSFKAGSEQDNKQQG